MTARLNVASTRKGVLFRVGDHGRPNKVSIADFIKVCADRKRVRNLTKREHNNN